MDIKKAVGDRIRQLRKKKGISQEELAFLADIDRTYITRLETGKRNITLLALKKVILALGIDYKTFFDHPIFILKEN